MASRPGGKPAEEEEKKGATGRRVRRRGGGQPAGFDHSNSLWTNRARFSRFFFIDLLAFGVEHVTILWNCFATNKSLPKLVAAILAR